MARKKAAVKDAGSPKKPRKRPSAKALALGMSTPEEREEKISSAIDSSVSMFGAGSAGTPRGVHALSVQVRGVISTGSLGLNDALGIGGYPSGRVVEIYGPASAGKTTLALHAAAECQKSGGVVCFVDAEHALDIEYAGALGVNLEEFIIAQPDCGEDALGIAESFIDSGASLVVIDSVAALVPRAELAGDMGASHPGLQARLMSQALRKLTAKVSKSDCILLFINQIRHKIGVQWGSPETTSGGNALKFYASVRLDIRRTGALKKGDEVYGNRTRVKVVKNKVAPPFTTAEFDLIYGKGISWQGELLDRALAAGVITKAGAWFSFGEIRLGHGRANSLEHIQEDAGIADAVLEALRKDDS